MGEHHHFGIHIYILFKQLDHYAAPHQTLTLLDTTVRCSARSGCDHSCPAPVSLSHLATYGHNQESLQTLQTYWLHKRSQHHSNTANLVSWRTYACGTHSKQFTTSFEIFHSSHLVPKKGARITWRKSSSPVGNLLCRNEHVFASVVGQHEAVTALTNATITTMTFATAFHWHSKKCNEQSISW